MYKHREAQARPFWNTRHYQLSTPSQYLPFTPLCTQTTAELTQNSTACLKLNKERRTQYCLALPSTPSCTPSTAELAQNSTASLTLQEQRCMQDSIMKRRLGISTCTSYMPSFTCFCYCERGFAQFTLQRIVNWRYYEERSDWERPKGLSV